MGWPPPGFDPAFGARLRGMAAEAERAQRRILDIHSQLDALRDEMRERQGAKLDLDHLPPLIEVLVAEALALGQPMTAALGALLVGETLLALGRPGAALVRATAARAAWASAVGAGHAPEREMDVRLLSLMAQAHAMLRNYDAVSVVCAEAIGQIEQDRYKVNVLHLQSAFLRDRVLIYKLAILAAYEQQDFATMLAWSELAKARFLLRYAPPDHVPTDPVREQRLRDLTDRVRVLDPAGDAKAAGIAPLQEERRRLWDLLWLSRTRPDGEEIRQGPAFRLDDLQRTLRDDEAVLSYYRLDDTALLVTTVDHAQVACVRIAIDDAGRGKLGRVLLGMGFPLGDAEKSQFDRAVAGCGHLLPPSVRTLIAGKRRLVISPHQKLHLFPFHALPWRDGFLIEDFSIAYVPNLTVLLRRPERRSGGKVLVANGGPYNPSLRLRDLPATVTEVKHVAGAYREHAIEADSLSGPEITVGKLRAWSDDGRLATYAAIHLATHGKSVFAEETVDVPMESQLYLTDSALDGLEIARLRLDADLVVLSACYSGQRATGGRGMEWLPGDELLGLQAAFAMAGARAVLGCLWPADDDIAEGIMAEFHRHRSAGVPDDVALARSMAARIRAGERVSCYDWAPFFLSIVGA